MVPLEAQRAVYHLTVGIFIALYDVYMYVNGFYAAAGSSSQRVRMCCGAAKCAHTAATAACVTPLPCALTQQLCAHKCVSCYTLCITCVLPRIHVSNTHSIPTCESLTESRRGQRPVVNTTYSSRSAAALRVPCGGSCAARAVRRLN